jgi:hypothetical protein
MDFLKDPKIPLIAGAAGALILLFCQFLYFVINLFSFYPVSFFYGFTSFISLIAWVLILACFGLKLFVLFKK